MPILCTHQALAGRCREAACSHAPKGGLRRRGDGARFRVGFIDMTGTRVGRLEVMSQADSVNGTARWVCKCDCGETAIVDGTKLRRDVKLGVVSCCPACRAAARRSA